MNSNRIDKFSDDYRFLSNFWPCDVYAWPTVEHAYQASKTQNLNERQLIMQCPTPGQAKRAGQHVTLRPDWNKLRIPIMIGLLRMKFGLVNPLLRELLLMTKDAELIEGNKWGDVYWGVSNGIGENNLGKLLMVVRKEIQVMLEGTNVYT